MFKIVFRIFFVLCAIAVISALLYVFDVPPFKRIINTLPETITSGEAGAILAEQVNLPANLQEPKIERQKTWQEMMDRAKALEQNGFPALAVAEYQQAYKKDNTKIEPVIEIGRIHLRNKAPEKAQIVFEELLKKNPKNTTAQIYLTRSLLSQRKIDEAKVILDSVTESTQQTQYYQGIVAAYFGKNDEAQKFLTDSLTLGTDADLTNKANNFLAAYKEFKFNAESPEVHLKVLLARSYIQCGEYQMAIPMLFEVTKNQLDYRDAWILLGYAYLQIEKYPDAIEALEKAKILDPQKPETLFYLGLGYYSMNDFDKAEQNFSQAKVMGYEPQIQVDQKLAEIYLQQKNYKKSAASYEKVISLNSADVNYYIKPIWIYLEELHDPDSALKLAQKAADEHPGAAMAQNLLGWVYIYKGRLSEAELYLKSAANLDPTLDATYLNLGLLYEKQDKNEQALAFYKKAHNLGKDNGVAASAATRYNSLIAKINNSSLYANIFATP